MVQEHVYFWEAALRRLLTNLAVPPGGEIKMLRGKTMFEWGGKVETYPESRNRANGSKEDRHQFNRQTSWSWNWPTVSWVSEHSHHWEHSSRSWLTTCQGCSTLCSICLEGEWHPPASFQTIPRVKPLLALSLEAEQTFSLPAPLPCAWKPISTDMNWLWVLEWKDRVSYPSRSSSVL